MPEPIDPAALEDIRRLCAEIDHLRKQLAELLSRYAINADTDSIRESLQDAEAKARQKAEEALQFALARVKHRDDQYIFMRAIDGDTIEVEPPNELKKWMRDIHVRLYGIDTPESNQEHGPHYTRILDQLCNINQRRLRIVWERERKGTEYEGFPSVRLNAMLETYSLIFRMVISYMSTRCLRRYLM